MDAFGSEAELLRVHSAVWVLWKHEFGHESFLKAPIWLNLQQTDWQHFPQHQAIANTASTDATQPEGTRAGTRVFHSKLFLSADAQRKVQFFTLQRILEAGYFWGLGESIHPVSLEVSHEECLGVWGYGASCYRVFSACATVMRAWLIHLLPGGQWASPQLLFVLTLWTECRIMVDLLASLGDDLQVRPLELTLPNLWQWFCAGEGWNAHSGLRMSCCLKYVGVLFTPVREV